MKNSHDGDAMWSQLVVDEPSLCLCLMPILMFNLHLLECVILVRLIILFKLCCLINEHSQYYYSHINFSAYFWFMVGGPQLHLLSFVKLF